MDNRKILQVSLTKRLKEKVYDAYGHQCKCCGETEPLFLTVDHTNNDGHTDMYIKSGIRIYGTHLYKKKISENFPSKYQILCWNCNTGKHRNNGKCPHKNDSK